MRELSTRTVLFHDLIGERLKLNPTDHKCLDVIIRSEQPMTASQLAEETGLYLGLLPVLLIALKKQVMLGEKEIQMTGD